MNKSIKPYRARNKIIKKLEEPDNQQNHDFNDDEEYGFLEVSVYNSVIDDPIENAELLVSRLTLSGLYQEKGEGKLVASARTGVNGYVPLIKLPALNRLQKISDENENSIYILSVRADGYYNAYAFEIQIYPDVTTSYRIKLRNIDESDDPRAEYDFLFEPHIPGHL